MNSTTAAIGQSSACTVHPLKTGEPLYELATDVKCGDLECRKEERELRLPKNCKKRMLEWEIIIKGVGFRVDTH